MSYFADIEMTLRDNEKIDDIADDLLERRDMRKRKEKKRSHKHTSEKDEYAKESFKKMKEEIEEMRKREFERAKELEELKKKIEDQQNKQQVKETKPTFAIGFDKEIYMNKGFIESAKWVKEVVSKNMIEKMTSEKNKHRFEAMLITKRNSIYLGARTCARFNRGEPCNQGKWHTTHTPLKPGALWTRHGSASDEDQRQVDRRNELRLHACTLCIEVLGAAFGHGVLECPWIMKKNWNE